MYKFTKEEIEIAKLVKAEVLKSENEDIRSIYMAGEICMWDELNESKIKEKKS